MNLIMVLILWTWGLTPTWVNTVGTVICGLKILSNIVVD